MKAIIPTKKGCFLLATAMILIAANSCSNSGTGNAKVTNIILFIGDGMGLADISAGIYLSKEPLNMARCKVVGLVNTSSASDDITDSAAGATAYSCGKRTKNGYLGVDTAGAKLVSIIEMAEKKGLSTGLIATSSITHATPAAFVAHLPGRGDDLAIAESIASSGVDLLIGGGRRFFTNRNDGRDLLREMASAGYDTPDTSWNPGAFQGKKLVWLNSSYHNPPVDKGRGNRLSVSLDMALKALGKNPAGFFLMTEGSQIDFGGHANDQDYLVSELLDFDKAVGEGMKYADNHPGTLVLVVADHETGGVTLGGDKRPDGTMALHFSTKNHTGSLVPLLAYGTGADHFNGFCNNTDVHDRMVKLLQLTE